MTSIFVIVINLLLTRLNITSFGSDNSNVSNTCRMFKNRRVHFIYLKVNSLLTLFPHWYFDLVFAIAGVKLPSPPPNFFYDRKRSNAWNLEQILRTLCSFKKSKVKLHCLCNFLLMSVFFTKTCITCIFSMLLYILYFLYISCQG